MRYALWHQPLIKKMPSRLTYSPIGCPVSIDSHPSPKLYLVSSQLNTSQDNSHEVVNRVTHFSPSWSKRNGNSFWPSSVVGGMLLYTPVFEQRATSWGTAWEYWEAFRGWSLVGRNELLGWVGELVDCPLLLSVYSLFPDCGLMLLWLCLPQWWVVSPSAVRHIKSFPPFVAFVRFFFFYQILFFCQKE